MKRIVSMMVIFTLLLGGMTHVQAQTSKAAEKAEKKQERKEKKEERLAKDAVMGEEAFNNAMQAITNRSFVLEANSVQPLNGRVYYVNSNTNFVSLNDGQAMVQIASNSPTRLGIQCTGQTRKQRKRVSVHERTRYLYLCNRKPGIIQRDQ